MIEVQVGAVRLLLAPRVAGAPTTPAPQLRPLTDADYAFAATEGLPSDEEREVKADAPKR